MKLFKFVLILLIFPLTILGQLNENGYNCELKYLGELTPEEFKIYDNVHDFIGYGGENCKIVSYDIAYFGFKRDLMIWEQSEPTINPNTLLKLKNIEPGDLIIFHKIMLNRKGKIERLPDISYLIIKSNN